MTTNPNDSFSAGPFYVDDPYGTAPGMVGPNTTGGDLQVVMVGDPNDPNGFVTNPNSVERAYIIHKQEALRWAAYHESKQRARKAAQESTYITDVGPVTVPENDSDARNYLFWRSLSTAPDTGAVDARGRDILNAGGTPFDVNRFAGFDRHFEGSNFEALHNKNHENYNSYAALRMNLAIVRNILYAQYFPDGRFDPRDEEDQRKAKMLKEMADELGGVLTRSTIPLLGEPLSQLKLSQANVPDLGAQRIYRYLQGRGIWDMTDIELTALHDPQVSAFYEATKDTAGIDVPLGTYMAERAELVKDIAITAAQPFITPEAMDPQAQMQSVEEARKILDKFRVQYDIATLDPDGKELPQAKMAFGEAQEDIVMTDQLTALARIYEENIKHLASIDGGMDPEMQALHKHTTRTLGKLAFAISDRAEWAIYNDWQDPQWKLKVTHLQETFPQDGQGNALPKEWRFADPGVDQPLLTYATGLYSSIQAVQARVRRLQMGKDGDEPWAGRTKGNQSNADHQPGDELSTPTSGIPGQLPNVGGAASNHAAGAGLRQTQISQHTQHVAAANTASHKAGAESFMHGSTGVSLKTIPQSLPNGAQLSSKIKGIPGLEQSLKNIGTSAQTAAATAAANIQRNNKVRTTPVANTAPSKVQGSATAKLEQARTKGTTSQPEKQATPQNVLPGNSGWKTPTKGPSV